MGEPPAESVIWTLKLNVPACVGVPPIEPLPPPVNDRPGAGGGALASDNVYDPEPFVPVSPWL